MTISQGIWNLQCSRKRNISPVPKELVELFDIHDYLPRTIVLIMGGADLLCIFWARMENMLMDIGKGCTQTRIEAVSLCFINYPGAVQPQIY